MTIDELKKEKAQLERDLLAMIHDRVEAFREKAGITPSSISVRTIPVQMIGEMHEKNLVSRVDVDITL